GVQEEGNSRFNEGNSGQEIDTGEITGDTLNDLIEQNKRTISLPPAPPTQK
ncbi:MAG: hypothetical protein HQL31_12830, partial [Planctomycetes bacterium]|nr:hypothetical protein [Planctomycetota bacterium]